MRATTYADQLIDTVAAAIIDVPDHVLDNAVASCPDCNAVIIVTPRSGDDPGKILHDAPVCAAFAEYWENH